MSAAVKQKTKTFSAKYNDDEKDGYNKLESRIKTVNDGIPFKNTDRRQHQYSSLLPPFSPSIYSQILPKGGI